MSLLLGRCCLALPLVLAPAAGAGTLFVDVSQTTGANDGSSWANAFQGPGGLQAALAVAAPGDQVWVAQGTYLASSTLDRFASFRFETGVEVYGGFDGTETALAERDASATPRSSRATSWATIPAAYRTPRTPTTCCTATTRTQRACSTGSRSRPATPTVDPSSTRAAQA